MSNHAVGPEPSSNGTPVAAKAKRKRNARSKSVEAGVTVPAIPRTVQAGETEALAMPCIAASKVQDRQEKWLSYGRLALGTMAVLDGSKGTGKSTISARVAAVPLGAVPLPGATVDVEGTALWFAGEESLPRVKAKVRAQGGDVDRLLFPGRLRSGRVFTPFHLPAHADVLDATIRKEGAKVVVLDVLNSFVRGVDMNQDIPARSVVEPLSQISEELDCLILALRHPRKTRTDNPVDKGLGGPAIAAVARSILMTGRDPESGGRVLGVISCNLDKKGSTILYEIEDIGGHPVLVWGDEIKLDVERFQTETVEEHVQLVRSEAVLLLRRRIGEGWVPSKDVLDEARKMSISEDAIHRARKRLDVPSRRVGKIGSDGHWEWGPPPAGWPQELK